MADKFKPRKPMRYPRPDGTTMSQIEFYDVLTNPTLDLRSIAGVVEPAVAAAQSKLVQNCCVPEIVSVRVDRL